MATLQEIQNIEFEMLKWFHLLCEQNNLKYSMVGGTMLGAVRHQGFIPWDDDVDVYLPMEDALKLLNVFQSDEYFLQCPETDIQTPYLMYKIRKNHTVMEDAIQKGLDIHKGIWIDVFLYTNAGRTKFARKMQTTLIKALQSFRCRYYNSKTDPKRKLSGFLTKLPPKLCLRIDRLLLKWIKHNGNKRSTEIVGLENENDLFFDKRYFEERKQYAFGGESFWGIKDYDPYLTRL